jgi:hypothetical protein
MSDNKISIATLAPLPGKPVAPQGPQLPAAPAQLHQGAAGLGPLPGAPLKVSTIPQRYLLGGAIPLGIALVLTIAGQAVAWPGTPGARTGPLFRLSDRRQNPPTQIPTTVPKPKKTVTQQPRQGTGGETSPRQGTNTGGPSVPKQEPAPRVETIPQATLDAANSGQPVPVGLRGVTAPVLTGGWPKVNPGARYADHIADVTVSLVVLIDGSVDAQSIQVSGPGAQPMLQATVQAYAPLRFQPGRVGSKVVPILLSHRYRYPE